MGLRVMVAVPTHDHCPAMFAYDLAQMMAFTGVNLVGGDNAPLEAVSLSFVTGTYVHSARQSLADIAVENGTDYVLWLDSDMRFPKDTLVRLLLHQKDVVGINYSSRGIPPRFVAIKQVFPAQYCITGPDSEGLEEVEAIGFGALLMKTDVLRGLPDPEGDDGPWFGFEWDTELRKMIGEDVGFCRLIREHGYSVYVDHDLSKECRHIGTLEYMAEHALETTEDANAKSQEAVEATLETLTPQLVEA